MPGLFAFWRSCTHCVLRFNQSESTRTKEKPARQPVSPKENRPLQPAGVRRLPDNPSLLKALVSAQQAKIEHLKFIIAKLRRMQFGRHSEQMDETVTQLELALEELECVRAEQSSDELAASVELIEPATESEATVPAKPKRLLFNPETPSCA